MLPSSSSTLYYPMMVDIYYSTETQTALGTIESEWHFDRSVPCSAVRPRIEQMEDFIRRVGRNIENISRINLRTADPINIDSVGTVYQYGQIMVTNIRAANGTSLWNEDDFTPTRFEIDSIEPVADAFGEIFGYRALISRSLEQS